MQDISKAIRQACIDHGTTMKQLEKDLGFANGYIQSLKKPLKNYDRAKAIHDRIGVPMSVLLEGYVPSPDEQEEQPAAEVPDALEIITEEHGEDAADTVKLVLQLNTVGQAEIRGELRQMLRLRKYNDALTRLVDQP